MRLNALLMLVFMLPLGFQTPTTLIVDAASGRIFDRAPCPVIRDAAPYVSIGAAARCALPGDTLDVQAGTYAETIVIDKDLVIQGQSATDTIVDGSQAGPVFTINADVTVTLRDLTITGGEADNGAGIYTPGGNIIIERSVISDNNAREQGAGLYAYHGTTTLRGARFSNNTINAVSSESGALAAGGGIYTYSGAVTIENSVITSNRISVSCGDYAITAYGGGLYTETGALELIGSTLSSNQIQIPACDSPDTITWDGDGAYTAAGRISLDSSLIDGRVATGPGGTLLLDGQRVDSLGQIAVAQVETAAPVIATSIPPTTTPTPAPLIVAEDNADVARRWMTQLVQVTREEALSPPVASRIFAYAGVTLYEAVVPGLSGYQSLTGQLHGLAAIPQPDASLVYDWPLVANSALAVVTTGLLEESAAAGTLEGFRALQQMLEMERGDFVPVNVYNRSRTQGEAVGQAILAWAAGDNYANLHNLTYVLPVGNPAFWQPLPGQQPLQPHWRSLRTFALPFASYCNVPLDIPFSTDPTSAFYAQANEVYTTVLNLNQEQQDIAVFWADNPGETASPPGHWLAIANQMVEQLRLDLGQAAELYALTGVALADAFISTWDLKYSVNLVRPVTYIREHMAPDWTPPVSTPPFPEYPSGHSVASGAAAAVLTDLLGEVTFTDATHASRLLPPRAFPSFDVAAAEAAMSRLYGGIHYRVAIENGLEQGRCVGQQVIDHIRTQN